MYVVVAMRHHVRVDRRCRRTGTASRQPWQPIPDAGRAAATGWFDRKTRASRCPKLQLHGFLSQGAFWSTDNDYIGRSSRGSVDLTQAALTATSDITDRLRVGMQFIALHQGLYGSLTPTLDWGDIDFRWKEWLGLRAGRIKIPWGLYNEYVDIDASRTQILLPQSVYPFNNRQVLNAATGASLYGTIPLHRWGELDYAVYGGSLYVPVGGDVIGTSRVAATTYEVDTHYLVGGQAFYRPIEGLRFGYSILRTKVDFYSDLDPASVAVLKAVMLVPPSFNGQLRDTFNPASLKVASFEYQFGDWLIAAEYSRWFAIVDWSMPKLLPTTQSHAERYYGMATYRLSERFETGLYYSVFSPNVYDRGGETLKPPKAQFQGFQKDTALSLRFDANEHWLWKLEGHFIDGTAALYDGGLPDPTVNLTPHRYWGMFLVNTTVTF